MVARWGLLALAGCTPAVAPPPSTTSPPEAPVCASVAAELDIAEEHLSRGHLLRAEAVVAGARAECEVDRRRAADLRVVVADRLVGTAPVDPFAEIEVAKKAGSEASAREHWDRAARSLETATGATGRPVYLRIRDPLGPGFRRSSPAPALFEGEVVATRGSGAEEPIRWVEGARSLGEAETLVSADGTARWLSAGRTEDVILGPFRLDAIATNTSRWLAACDPAGLHLFDRRERKLHKEIVRTCASTLVLGGEDRLVEIHDDSIAVLALPSLEVLGEVPREEGLAERYAIARSGRTFAIVEGGTLDPTVVVRVFDVARGVEIAALKRTQPAPLQIAVSPDGGKIAMVDETIQVFDVASRRTRSLGNRAFHTLRSGIYAHNGWGDTTTPPASTDAVAALDDGRTCIVQAGVGVIVPRSPTDHCSIGEDGVARGGKVRSTGGTTWATPPAFTEDSQQTLLITPSGREVLRVETRRDESFVVTYDAATGTELRRAALGNDGSVELAGFVGDGGIVRLAIGGNSQEAGEPRLLDRMTGEVSADTSAPIVPWYLPSVMGGLMHVLVQPSGARRVWDLRTLEPHREAAPAPPALTGLTFYEASNGAMATFSSDTSDPASRLPLATLVPMDDGIAVFFASGEIELTGIAAPPADLVCSYGRVLVPFETCAGTRLVDGAWKETVARAAAAGG